MTTTINGLSAIAAAAAGDELAAWDVSESGTRKMTLTQLFALLLAQANTFTAAQTIAAATGNSQLALNPTDNGSGIGAALQLGRNSNGSTPAAGFVQMVARTNTAYSVWPDNTGLLRIHTATPTNANDTAGTVVGTQTSSLRSKDILGEGSELEDVFAAVQRGAEAVRTFRYKSGAYNGEVFEGVVVDFAPRYGMDRDAEHPNGKSLNEINIIGDLLRAVAWLLERELARG